MTLFISRTLPPTFIRLISLYLDAYPPFFSACLLGLLALFSVLGKYSACSHTVYIVYVNVGGQLVDSFVDFFRDSVFSRSLFVLSSSIAFLISAAVNSLSSSVWLSSLISFRILSW